ncbi:hypothetical protein PC123_g25672 [Phytophthora cactorum]|nr:hypothetical protein PC120_g25240 [Phytophthora cactorum]KAG4038767.1 hypothetical protein PC123_g25672 [Phytophthora cactorum]
MRSPKSAQDFIYLLNSTACKLAATSAILEATGEARQALRHEASEHPTEDFLARTAFQEHLRPGAPTPHFHVGP